DNLIIRFLLLKEQNLVVGSKLVNRYGGKGVISQILPDEEMPITEDGRRAEIILNPLGVISRLNPSQLFEQELNFIATYIQDKIKKTEDTDKCEELLFDFLGRINPSQCESLRNYYESL